MALAGAGGLARIKLGGKEQLVLAFRNKVYAYDYDERKSRLIAKTLLPIRGLAVCDVNGNGSEEIIVATGGTVRVFTPDGEILRRFDVRDVWPAQIICSDINGDGKKEIVVSASTRAVYVLEIDGRSSKLEVDEELFVNLRKEVGEKYRKPDAMKVFPIASYDVDGDGLEEVIVQPVSIYATFFMAEGLSKKLLIIDYSSEDGYSLKEWADVRLHACYAASIIDIGGEPYLFMGLEKGFSVLLPIRRPKEEEVIIMRPTNSLAVAKYDVDGDGEDELIITAEATVIVADFGRSFGEKLAEFKEKLKKGEAHLLDPPAIRYFPSPIYEIWAVAPFRTSDGRLKIAVQGPHLDYIAILDYEKDGIVEGKISAEELKERMRGVELLKYDDVVSRAELGREIERMLSDESVPAEAIALKIIDNAGNLSTEQRVMALKRLTEALKRDFRDEVFKASSEVVGYLNINENKEIVSSWLDAVLKAYAEGRLDDASLSDAFNNIRRAGVRAIPWGFNPTGGALRRILQVQEHYVEFVRDLWESVSPLADSVKRNLAGLKPEKRLYLLTASHVAGLGPGLLKETLETLTDESLPADERSELLMVAMASLAVAKERIDEYVRLVESLGKHAMSKAMFLLAVMQFAYALRSIRKKAVREGLKSLLHHAESLMEEAIEEVEKLRDIKPSGSLILPLIEYALHRKTDALLLFSYWVNRLLIWELPMALAFALTVSLALARALKVRIPAKAKEVLKLCEEFMEAAGASWMKEVAQRLAKRL